MKKPKKVSKSSNKSVQKKPKTIANKFPEEIEQTLIAIRELHKGEQLLLKESREKKRKALVLAFEIGRYIHDMPKKYSKKMVKTLAKEWGCSGQTVYNYDHLYCGVLFESNITACPQINREYFQALGSSIRPVDDFFGYVVYLHLLKNPAYKQLKKSDERKVDPARVLEIGQLVKYTRKVAIDDLKAGNLLGKFMREPNGMDGNPSFLFPAVETNSKKGVGLRQLCGLLLHEVSLLVGDKFGTVKFQDFNDIKDEIYGSQTPHADFRKLTAKLLIIRRQRLKRQVDAYTGTPELLIKSAEARIFHERCEEVLLDRKLFPERSVDCVITDPPYSDAWYEAWKKSTTVAHDAEKTVAIQAELLGTVASLLVKRKIAREQFSWFSFCPIELVHMFLPPLLRAFESEDFIYQVLAWDKQGITKVGPVRFFGRQVEAVLYFNCGTRPLAMLKREGDQPRLLHSSLLSFHADRKDKGNVFWKPTDLLTYLITLATGEGQSPKERNQVILDPFAGSGSTGVAAIECGREFRLIESHDNQIKDCRASVIKALKKADRFEG